LLPTERAPATVIDGSGDEIEVNGWHRLSAPPDRVTLAGVSRDVRSWAGPWPVVERWWEADGSRRAVRLQVVLENQEDETAVLLLREGGRWLVEGMYD
jgi:protein ImuB